MVYTIPFFFRLKEAMDEKNKQRLLDTILMRLWHVILIYSSSNLIANSYRCRLSLMNDDRGDGDTDTRLALTLIRRRETNTHSLTHESPNREFLNFGVSTL